MVELAKADGSAAWNLGVQTQSGAVIARMRPEIANEVFGRSPNAKVCISVSPTVWNADVRDDGWFVHSAVWGWSSGSRSADWALVVVPPDLEDGAGARFAVVPISELTVEDTWYTVGMRATGSNTLVARDVFIPRTRATPFLEVVDGRHLQPGEPVYQPFEVGGRLVFTAPQLGLASAALEHVIAKAATRPISATNYKRQVDSVGFQLQVADAAMKIDAAFAVAKALVDELQAVAAGDADQEWMADARGRCRHALIAKLCREAVDILMTAHGTSSLADANPLQRIWRDLAIASRHAQLAWAVTLEGYGKTLLGVEDEVTTAATRLSSKDLRDSARDR
jgi:alkylation response protein AidB-like acyl-CoA dehydrogenase